MNVLLADDHPLFLEGLRNLLVSRGFTVVGTARNGLEALEKARALHPELIIMDIQMPQFDGLSAVRLIKMELPETKIVMLTVSAEDEDLFGAIKNGACGYLLKTQDTDEFFALLEAVTQGEAVLGPGLTTRILHEFARWPSSEKQSHPELSPRQIQVLTLVAQGLTYKEVGEKLFLSERTIKYHMGQIVARLHIHHRAEVIEYARRSGLV
ncbi:MAG: response regulator transcription factor [Deltaproteobacteria bacterium]|jgi:two-component system NarL family response regulator|nr:response regulator transcription factor [Deltaproteobacteria bacterium]